MKTTIALICLCSLMLARPSLGEDVTGTVILEDNFDRQEKDPEKEQVGNGWSTNSQTRAKGVKQVDLVDGALHIKRAEVADHGVSLRHEIAFRDAVIQLRFKLGARDDVGVNIADMKEKAVHAGHICMVRIRPKRVEIVDLKTGRMDLATRKKRLADKLTAEDKERIKKKSKFFKTDLAADKWHQLEVKIIGERMSVVIDGEQIGEFRSTGIGHATKSRLRLAVNRSAWVDDVKVVRLGKASGAAK